MFWHGCISDLQCKYEYCSLAELSAKPCQTPSNCGKSFQISPDCGIYLCRTWWITRILHTHLARNGPKFTRICTYIALRFQNFPWTQDDTFWLVFGGPPKTDNISVWIRFKGCVCLPVKLTSSSSLFYELVSVSSDVTGCTQAWGPVHLAVAWSYQVFVCWSARLSHI